MNEDSSVIEQIVADDKNAIIDSIKTKMGICPYYGTTEILDEVMFQKKSWGGKEYPENTVKMSASANVEYVRFAEKAGLKKDQTLDYYKDLFQQFIVSPKPKMTEKQRLMSALQILCSVRDAFGEEKNAMLARLRNRGKNLDIVFPIEESSRLKILEIFRKENQSLVDDLKEKLSWDNIIGCAVAQMGYVQKSLIEKEIEKLIVKHPLWQYFGQYIPGFGMWTCAFFIANLYGSVEDKLQGPKRFSDSGKLRAYCGVAPIGGQTMKMKRGDTAETRMTYNPGMKEMLCKIFPESFWKVAGKFPDEPYAKYFRQCWAKQAKKAQDTTIADLMKKYGVLAENITSLGYKESEKEGEEGRQIFQGFKILKATGGDPITTLNPGHVFQRTVREWATNFLGDFYHMWLFLEGENPNITGNPRIMAVIQKSKGK